MPPKRKSPGTTSSLTKKNVTKDKSINQKHSTLVDQLSMIANQDEDEQLVSFDSNEGILDSKPAKDDDFFKSQPSKIPKLSPQKKKQKSTTTTNATNSISKLKEDINFFYKTRDIEKLMELNNSLKTDFVSELDLKYKTQLEKANSLINKLVEENAILNERLLQQSQRQDNINDDDEITGKDSAVIFDIIELLTNLSCVSFSEDEEKMQFVLKQSLNDLEMTYKLIINKFERIDDILYIPIFPKDDIALKKLKLKLPEYFLDELSFPSSNLNNFYNKINRSLSKD